jgi:hypothetical protein
MDILRAVQGLSIGSIKPLCPDHKPTGQYVRLSDDLGGGITYEVTCPNCNFHAFVHPDAVEDL